MLKKMGLYKYSHKAADEKAVARSQVHDVNASYKDMSQVLAAIMHKPVKTAIRILEEAISMKKAIPYKRFAKGIGHRSELGGKKGRYPKKEAKIVMDMLKNAIANAEFKGFDKESLYIKAASSHKQNKLMRYRRYWAGGVIIGYGKQSYASKYVTCWAELTLAQSAKGKKKSEAKNVKATDKKVETKTAIAKSEKAAVSEKTVEQTVEKPTESKTTEKIEIK